MTIDSIERFEIKARAFQIMTGKMAPGKDVPAALCRGDDYECREKLWKLWNEAYGKAVDAVISATQEIMGDD